MSPTPTPLIEVNQVSLLDGSRSLLQDISLTLQANQIVSLVGPNGAGKTSLVKVILGLTLPTTGKVTRRAGLRVGYMPQKILIEPLFPLTVQGFLQLGQTCSKPTLQAILEEVGVTHVLQQPLRSVSGGEFQRVLLARALLRQPELLVLDEPAQGVDLIGQGELYDLIAKVRERYHCGILLVSHDLNMVMAQTDIVVCLNQHICCSGHPDKVSRDPAFAALFGKTAQAVAFYTHRHDHHHDVHGQVVTQDKDKHD